MRSPGVLLTAFRAAEASRAQARSPAAAGSPRYLTLPTCGSRRGRGGREGTPWWAYNDRRSTGQHWVFGDASQRRLFAQGRNTSFGPWGSCRRVCRSRSELHVACLPLGVPFLFATHLAASTDYMPAVFPWENRAMHACAHVPSFSVACSECSASFCTPSDGRPTTFSHMHASCSHRGARYAMAPLHSLLLRWWSSGSYTRRDGASRHKQT